MDHVRSDARRGTWLGDLFAVGALYRLAGTFVERVGDQLRLRAPSADGATPAAQQPQLERFGARVVQAEAAGEQGVAAIVAGAARVDHVCAATDADRTAGDGPIRNDRSGDPAAAVVFALASAEDFRSESATRFAHVCGVAAIAGAAWIYAA